MNEIDEIEQIITMGYGNPRERAEQIWALFSVSGRLNLKQIELTVQALHFEDSDYGNSPEDCYALIEKTRKKIGYTKEDVDNYR